MKLNKLNKIEILFARIELNRNRVINDLVPAPTAHEEPLVTIATDEIAMKYVHDWVNSSSVGEKLKPIREEEVSEEEEENTQQSRRSTRSTAKRVPLLTITRLLI